MLDQVSILLPFKPDNGIRNQEFQWLIRFYNKVMPMVEICVAENLDEPFNISKAINAAAKKATRDIFVLSGGDVVYDPDVLIEALHLLPQVPWILPFNRVMDISKEKTEELLSLEPTWPLPLQDSDCSELKIYDNFAGKINIFTREAFQQVGGFDERFVGWGGEDDAFLLAMNTLCGSFKRLDRTIYHFWHPWATHYSIPHFNANRELLHKYQQASGDREAMRKVIHVQ